MIDCVVIGAGSGGADDECRVGRARHRVCRAGARAGGAELAMSALARLPPQHPGLGERAVRRSRGRGVLRCAGRGRAAGRAGGRRGPRGHRREPPRTGRRRVHAGHHRWPTAVQDGRRGHRGRERAAAPVAGARSSRPDRQHPHADYRAPEQLPPGRVLVVGSGQSGSQITHELLGAGREVVLATSPVGRVPTGYRGQDAYALLVKAGFFDQSPGDPPNPAMMHAPQPVLAPGARPLSLQRLARAGATLAGRVVAIDNAVVHFDHSAPANIAAGDAFAAQAGSMLDAIIAARPRSPARTRRRRGPPGRSRLAGCDRAARDRGHHLAHRAHRQFRLAAPGPARRPRAPLPRRDPGHCARAVLCRPALAHPT